MGKFDDIISGRTKVLSEAEMAPTGMAPNPPPAAMSDIGAGGGAPSPAGGGGSPSPDAGAGAAGGAETEMDDDAKKEADPNEFTRSVLQKIAELTPEMFSNYVDMYSKNFNDITDKEGFKKYYNAFYQVMKYVTVNADRMKQMFATIQKMAKSIPTSNDTAPDMAKGGVGMAGPSGPGVQ